MEYGSLYKLYDPLATRPFILSVPQDWIDIPKANQLFYGTWQPPEPVLLKAVSGGQAADVLWTGLPPLFVVSQKVIDILHRNRFTGWGIFPVEVYDRKGAPLPRYQGFSIKSYAGKQDYSRSTFIMKPLVPGGKPSGVYKGTFFDESKWDGSDIFRIQHAIIIVTKPVMQEFKRNKIANVRFTPLLKTETDELIYESLKRSGQL